MPPKTNSALEYVEIRKELAEIKEMLASRKHVDEDFQLLKQDYNAQMNGNGKPGLKSIRDKVMSWEAKTNAIIILILGDVAVRIFFLVR